jgi:hypothetical protein
VKTFNKYVEQCNVKNAVYSAPVKKNKISEIDKKKLVEGKGGYTVI